MDGAFISGGGQVASVEQGYGVGGAHLWPGIKSWNQNL